MCVCVYVCDKFVRVNISNTAKYISVCACVTVCVERAGGWGEVCVGGVLSGLFSYRHLCIDIYVSLNYIQLYITLLSLSKISNVIHYFDTKYTCFCTCA